MFEFKNSEKANGERKKRRTMFEFKTLQKRTMDHGAGGKRVGETERGGEGRGGEGGRFIQSKNR
jgi:hypothetical protein